MKFPLTKPQSLLKIIPLAVLIWANFITIVSAQNSEQDRGCNIPSSDRFQTGFRIQAQETTEEKIVSATTPSQTEMTTPSLWWAVEKFDPLDGKLVTNWQANKNKKVIDLIVNNRLWRTLDYIEQYSLVNRFGTVAREYNYNLSVISPEQDCLATYTCDLTATPANCGLKINPF